MNKRLYSMSDGIEFDLESCRFKEFAADMEPQALIDQMSAPVSVILQITRRCNLNCVFCSEPEQIPDTSLEDLKTINNNLKGTHRVFLSGGEPLIRKDFNRVLDIFCENYILGVPTNAMISDSMLLEFKEKVSFVNVGLDGPRAVTSRMRGDFDAIIDGIGKFKAAGIPVSLTSVVLRSTSDTVLYTCQLADALGAKKLKLVLPIRKGNAVALDDNEYMSHEECIPLFERIVEAKENADGIPKLHLAHGHLKPKVIRS